MGNSKTLTAKPPKGSVEVSIEQLLLMYLDAVSGEATQHTVQLIKLCELTQEELCKLVLAQSLLLTDLVEGPLSGMKFYVNDNSERLH